MSSAPSATRVPAPRFSMRRLIPALVIAAFVLLPVYAIVGGDGFMLAILNRILILAIAAAALNLILGYGGMVSFGHALFLGLGVYSVAIPAFHGVDNALVHLLLAITSCGLVGLVTGAIALRTTGIAFIMITLAFAQMFFFVFVSLSPYGGDDGLRLAASSTLAGISLGDPRWLYACSACLLAAALYGMHRLVRSRFGMALCGSRINERRMRALGFPTFRYRLCAYVLSAMLCGVAGMLYANLTQFAAPSYMSWAMSGELIVMVVLGGMASILGPLYGAAAMLITEEVLKGITEHWMILFGPAIVAVAVASRRGIAGLLAEPASRLLNETAPAVSAQVLPEEVATASGRTGTVPPTGTTTPVPTRSDGPASLRVENLVKRYGGLLATDNVSLALRTGTIHAVIGPNGAGKSTLVGQLAGEIEPDSGRIYLDDREITSMPVHARSLLGLMRSFQITSVLPAFTALENVMLSAQAHQGHSFRFWQPAAAQSELRAPALAALRETGLAAWADTPAGVLAHGQQRQLELAMVIAGRPRILLLDEPMAGMSQAESRQMTALLRELRTRYAILLIEHDMEAVFSLADTVSVLVYGRCIATGSPDEIRSNPTVQAAYLGDEA